MIEKEFKKLDDLNNKILALLKEYDAEIDCMEDDIEGNGGYVISILCGSCIKSYKGNVLTHNPEESLVDEDLNVFEEYGADK